MKKVLVLAAAMLFAATPVFASSIVGSKHDLRAGQPGGNSASVNQTGTTTQVCVFCHTPHGASLTVKPLWNRSHAVTMGATYNSVTLSSFSRPSGLVYTPAQTDAPLCISCHDAAGVVGGLLNPPNDGTVVFGGTGFGVGSNLNIDTDLTNDHPIGMNYTAAANADNTASPGSFNVPMTVSLNLYGPQGAMWCSTCHDVHDDANSSFLALATTGSDLCLNCHIK